MWYEVQIYDRYSKAWVTVHNGRYTTAPEAAERFLWAVEAFPESRYRIMSHPSDSRRYR